MGPGPGHHSPEVTDLIESQVEYYRARAQEYDEWFLRQGRYDRGSALNERWFSEVEVVRQWLTTRGSLGDVLELAAGNRAMDGAARIPGRGDPLRGRVAGSPPH